MPMDPGASCDPARLAELARLELRPEELDRFREQLTHLIDAFNRIGELDTTGVEPFTHADDSRQPPRGDEPAGVPSTERRVAVPPLFGSRRGGER